MSPEQVSHTHTCLPPAWPAAAVGAVSRSPSPVPSAEPGTPSSARHSPEPGDHPHSHAPIVAVGGKSMYNKTREVVLYCIQCTSMLCDFYVQWNLRFRTLWDQYKFRTFVLYRGVVLIQRYNSLCFTQEIEFGD